MCYNFHNTKGDCHQIKWFVIIFFTFDVISISRVNGTRNKHEEEEEARIEYNKAHISLVSLLASPYHNLHIAFWCVFRNSAESNVRRRLRQQQRLQPTT